MARRVFQFEDFRLDLDARELRRTDGRSVLLPSRVFECIAWLIEHRDRAVGRDELIATIWNRADSGDNLLAQLVVRARKLLGDTGEEQRTIRTVPGFGYRWVAATRLIESTDAAAPAATPETAEPEEAEAPVLVADPARHSAHDVPDAPVVPLRNRMRLAGGILACAFVLASGFVLVQRVLVEPRALPVDGVAEALPPMEARPALALPAIVEAGVGEAWLRLGIMALVSEQLAASGQPMVPSDNVAALTRGEDIAALDAAALARLAETAVAGRIVQSRIARTDTHWRVTLTVVHGDLPGRLEVSSEGEQVFDAARAAADRLAVAMGLDAGPRAPALDEGLDRTLKQAEAAYLDGDAEAARTLLATARRDHPASPELAYQEAWLDLRTGRTEQAEAGFQTLANSLSADDEPVALARTLNGLANACLRRGDFTCIAQRAQQAIDLVQDIPAATVELGRAYQARAAAASAHGRPADALADLARARVALVSSGNRLGVARVDMASALIQQAAGRVQEAMPLLDSASGRLHAFHDASNEAAARGALAYGHLLLLDPASALAEAARARQSAARTQNTEAVDVVDFIYVESLIDNGRLAEAQPLLAAAYRHVIDSETRRGTQQTYHAHAVAARYAAAADDPDTARTEAAAAVAAQAYPETDDRHIAQTYLLLAQLTVQRDAEAAAAVRSALAARAGAGAERGCYLSLIDALIGARRGDTPAAHDAFEHALRGCDGTPVDRLRVAQAYVPWLIGQNRNGRAAEIVGGLGEAVHRHFDAAVLEARLYRALGQRAAWQGAVDRARALAGERRLPADIALPAAQLVARP